MKKTKRKAKQRPKVTLHDLQTFLVEHELQVRLYCEKKEWNAPLYNKEGAFLHVGWGPTLEEALLCAVDNFERRRAGP